MSTPVALITGVGDGTGAALAHRFAQGGYRVAMLARIQFRDGDVVLNPGEMFVIPRGKEHCPIAEEETHILYIEPAGTKHSGEVDAELTKHELEWI